MLRKLEKNQEKHRRDRGRSRQERTHLDGGRWGVLSLGPLLVLARASSLVASSRLVTLVWQTDRPPPGSEMTPNTWSFPAWPSVSLVRLLAGNVPLGLFGSYIISFCFLLAFSFFLLSPKTSLPTPGPCPVLCWEWTLQPQFPFVRG